MSVLWLALVPNATLISVELGSSKPTDGPIVPWKVGFAPGRTPGWDKALAKNLAFASLPHHGWEVLLNVIAFQLIV